MLGNFEDDFYRGYTAEPTVLKHWRTRWSVEIKKIQISWKLTLKKAKEK